MKRLIIGGVLIALLCASTLFAADRMRIAYSSISGAYVGIWVAHDAGFFAKEGLDDQMILIPNGTQLAQVTVAGEVDIASLGGGAVLAAAFSGADFKVIGANVNKMVFSMYAKPEIKRSGRSQGANRSASAVRLQRRYFGPLCPAKAQSGSAERCHSVAVGADEPMFGRAQSRHHRCRHGVAAYSIFHGKARIQRNREYHGHESCLSKPRSGRARRHHPKETGSDRSLHARLCPRRASG